MLEKKLKGKNNPGIFFRSVLEVVPSQMQLPEREPLLESPPEGARVEEREERVVLQVERLQVGRAGEGALLDLLQTHHPARLESLQRLQALERLLLEHLMKKDWYSFVKYHPCEKSNIRLT